MSRKTAGLCVAALIVILCSGCSPRRYALHKTADALTSGTGTVFAGDSDPELIEDALPFALKMYESLLASLPEHVGLLTATGKSFCMYAYAFIHMPADTLPDSKIELQTQKLRRAKSLYLRARGYLLRGLEARHPGFRALLDSNQTDTAMAMVTEADSSLLYWAAMAWSGAFVTNKFDFSMAVEMKKPLAFMRKMLELHPSFGQGGVHEFFISYYGGTPRSMGGSEQKAREHFARALELADSAKAGPYVALATTVAVANQDLDEYKSLLNKALAIDVDASPSNRLANIITQRKAAWLLNHIDYYFLVD
jgi:predicted anti-sigma-YlaC factor YlaD